MSTDKDTKTIMEAIRSGTGNESDGDANAFEGIMKIMGDLPLQ